VWRGKHFWRSRGKYGEKTGARRREGRERAKKQQSEKNFEVFVIEFAHARKGIDH